MNLNAMDAEETVPEYIEVKMTMSAARDYSCCSVCTGTMTPPIFQCRNGHVFCRNCSERIDICIECRVQLEPKIRNIAIEKVINNLIVDCSNKPGGCDVKITIECLQVHLQVCPYT